MAHYRRNFIHRGRFFFTVNLADRRSRLLTDHIDQLRNAFRYARVRHAFTIDAIVVLPDHLHAIWQRRYWEHTLRDENDFEQHCHYIHYNPVKHGHAAAASQWPYSSFQRFVKLGLYPLDWAEGQQIEGDKFGE